MIKFSIVITTKNRLTDLKVTLKSLNVLLQRNDVELLICDDNSTDGTVPFLQQNYIQHTLILNKETRGLIYNRNVLNSKAKGNYIISLDDDANFLTTDPLEKIEYYFTRNPACAVLSFRVFWGLKKPTTLVSFQKPKQVNSFVGCGHVWRKEHWQTIPNYPSWFIFYGEENFASNQLLKLNLQVHYFPEVLVHHRANIKGRKKQKDYSTRLRRSFRSGWYMYFLFYPVKKIPRLLLYTLWIQIKKKTLKGDMKATIGILQAVFDVFINLYKLVKNSNRFTEAEFKTYKKLPEAILYWNPTKN